ncbi:bifunctional glycosyltransferase family 2/GtrA family protein [Acetobacterium tundrae]|uniref:Glycosyltransferase n=1 Tax=Acetobacterium tundrae TaxID=132932 RepID=A0ABR6WJL2_9FIRM|nr:bifunctional glycosyltransferase family 2/GtrA family protein [Acetobacterium tundrae]MBC3796360.1 glycosyltransferase [Acetobacterium tundrae]
MESVLIIPALNPDEKLITLVEKLKQNDIRIVIINDGSEEKYDNIFKLLKYKFRCELCTHTKNMGKGVALKTGLRYASLKYPDCSGYVMADADGQHSTEDILKVADTLDKNPDSLVLGTRDFDKKNIPFKSRWGNRITSFVFLLSTSHQCSDTQTGLRGIPKQFTEMCLSIPGDRYEYEMNMLLETGKNGIPFIYVPIETIYLEDNKSSHFHAIKDSVCIYLNILKFSLSSLASAIIDLILFTVFVNYLFGTGSGGILAATVTARVMSGCVNFMINKHWVFQSKNNNSSEVLQYMVLFFSQMILSWLFVTCLSNLSDNLTIIKILVDSSLFLLSYQIQKNLIFHKKRKGTI